MARTFEEFPLKKEVPKEQVGNVLYGIFGHLGSPISFIVVLAIFGVTLLNVGLAFLAVSFVFMTFTLWAEKQHPSVELPPYNFKDFIAGLGVVFYKGILVGGGFIVLGWYGFTYILPHGDSNNAWWAIILATFLTDLAYYWIHRMMSHSKGQHPILRFYRRKHAAHHSVAEMDFLRGNQSSLVDVAFSQFQPSLILISAALGMTLPATLAAYALILMLQATDHTSVTYNIGILSWIFMDNHAHKLHHCRRGNLINHAAAFSIYDRLWGTYYENWDYSSNYLHHHRISLPIKPIKKKPQSQTRQPVPG